MLVHHMMYSSKLTIWFFKEIGTESPIEKWLSLEELTWFFNSPNEENSELTDQSFTCWTIKWSASHRAKNTDEQRPSVHPSQWEIIFLFIKIVSNNSKIINRNFKPQKKKPVMIPTSTAIMTGLFSSVKQSFLSLYPLMNQQYWQSWFYHPCMSH